MKIKWIFFDIDNTLFDSRELASRARKNAVNAMIKAGLPEQDSGAAYEKLVAIVKKFGSNYSNHFNELLKTYNIESSKLVAAAVVAYHNTKFEYLKPYENAIPTLLELGESGYKLGVITNGRAVKQWDKLIRLGVSEFFKIVVISEEVGIEKPDKGIFELALEKAGCKAEESVMIGDKEIDIAPATGLGMNTVCLGDYKADFNIRKIGEVRGVIDGIKKK